ncbi:serine carboxypeptidase 24 isoform X2 [Physcomitrium patens]|uniref:serine carboxypeptidase 24 isoform X2 n=1 Tax=Physcomitrium patens TaxID=3218 RepID=UPI000D169FD7|nr:serine carboxypeptidase 2-like isoform X2 [Physcomitrium patens]|eukprot:XP_024385315.1 serine carboxypeptidase 2-like isoform X2 [Physcomitrella patens]
MMRRPVAVAVWLFVVVMCLFLDSPSLAVRWTDTTERKTLEYGCGEEQDVDRIVALPGQPPVDFAMYAGYITVDEKAGRAHYYFFVEAEENSEEKPLVFWFNGGPGCSSIAYGFAEELGPFFINSGGESLRLNRDSGNKVANVLFVESPAGTGFSYSNTSSDLLAAGDFRTDNYAFVTNWFKRFPQYRGRPFFLAGESYAGLYIPELAKLIYDNNKKLTSQSRINFMGFMVGNPVIDAYSDNWGYIDFLYYHALISDETYSQMKKACKFTHDNAPLSRECIQLMFYQSTNEYGGIDPYSIYAPACVSESSTNSSRNHFHRGLQQTSKNPVLGLVRQGYDPCTYDNSLIYFNRPDVQKAMHANTTGIPYPWVGCSDQLIVNWKDSAATVLPIYRELLNAGLRLWVISGDSDSVVPVTGTRYALASLNLPIVVPWYSWYHHQQVGGREVVYKGNLTLVVVRGAGHEVPLLRSAQWLQVFESFLKGSLLPSNPYN